MSDTRTNRILLPGVICGLLVTVLAATEFSAQAQETEQQDAEGSAQAENTTSDAEQKALEAEIAAVEKMLESGDKNDVEEALSEFETDKPLPADVALSLPSDI